MRVGLQYNPQGNVSLESILEHFVQAEAEGFSSIWLGQVFDHDVLTLLALAGTRTERIELGVSVIPLPTRHPTVLVQQALTTQLATHGRLCLGVGCGHAAILDRKLGLENDDPVGRTREALEVLRPLLSGEYVKYEGRYQRVRVGIPIEGAEPPSVILAALGPRMVELAGELTDGVTVVFVGADYIAQRVRPHLPASARIVASLPVAVTDVPEIVKPVIDLHTKPSMGLAAYQRALALQNAERISDVGFVGSPAQVEDGLAALAEAGVTDLNPVLIDVDGDPGCVPRTRELLASYASA